MRLASRFGYANQIRRDRPLTREELMHHVPGIFGEDKHTSRSRNYTYIPTITVLESLQREGFSHSSPARPAYVTRAAGGIPNTCCVCAVTGR